MNATQQLTNALNTLIAISINTTQVDSMLSNGGIN